MTSVKQFQLVMRDMMFITWEVEPEVVRKLVDHRLELDTVAGSNGRVVALVSAVSFRVAEVRSNIPMLPGLNFEQVNYRVYVKEGELPAVSFLDINVNSRMVATITGFMSVPIHYEDIDIKTSAGGDGLLNYSLKSDGVRAELTIGERVSPNGKITTDFITARFVGFVRVGDALFRIEVEQPGLNTVPARVRNISAPSLEQLGVLTPDQSARPYSALYVREALFGGRTPTRVS